MQSLRFGLRRVHLNRFVVDADPAWSAILDCLFFRREIPAALLLTFFRRTREDFSVETTPAYTIVLGRLFFGTETLTTAGLTIGLGG